MNSDPSGNNIKNKRNLTPEIRAHLTELRTQTGVDAAKLLKSMDQVPDGLSRQRITMWLSGRVKTARKDHLDAVIAAWEALPRYEFFEITPAQQNKLRRLIEESGIGAVALLRGQRQSSPDGLSAAVITAWLQKPGHRIRKDQYDWAVKRWEMLIARRASMVNLNEARLQALEKEQLRAGISLTAPLAGANELPEGLHEAMVRAWMYHKEARARADHYEFVLAFWQDLPSATPSLVAPAMRVPLTETLRSELNALAERSALGPSPLFKWARLNGLNIPEVLRAQHLNAALSGRTKTISAPLLDFAREAWAAAIKAQSEPIPIKPWQLKTLQNYKELGFLPDTVFEGRKDVPDGLNPAEVTRWLDGTAKNFREYHFNWLNTRCKALAEAEKRYVEITEELRAKLISERERTGIGQTELLREAKGIPEGLNAPMIAAWINGTIQSARKDRLDWVLAQWESLVPVK